MNNDENKKRLVPQKRLNESEQKEIAGGERIYLNMDQELNDGLKEYIERIPSMWAEEGDFLKTIEWKNNSYFDVNGNDSDKLVVEFSGTANLNDLTPNDRKLLKGMGLL